MVRVLTVDDRAPFLAAARAVLDAMPGMDGLEVSRRLADGFPGMCIVLVSGDDDPSLRDAPEGARAAAFIRKQGLRPALLRRTWEQPCGRD